VNRRNGRCLSQHRDGDDLALRETGDGNLVHLLQLLDEGADSGAVPMPASCQFGNGDYKLPVGQAELLLAQILGDVLYRSLVYKVKVGFELRQPYPGPLFQELQQGHPFRHLAGTRSMFLFLHFNNLFGEYCCLSPAPLYKRNGMIQVILNSSI
ncbi:hypothetical protein, partial [Bacteroides sp.]